jgi:hypothetical protein
MKLKALLPLIVFAIAAGAHGQQSPSGSGSTATTFDKFWVVAVNQFDQANQFATSLAQFANGPSLPWEAIWEIKQMPAEVLSVALG